MMARLIHKEVQEINNDVQSCPVCHGRLLNTLLPKIGTK